jgi:hypothetical protein
VGLARLLHFHGAALNCLRGEIQLRTQRESKVFSIRATREDRPMKKLLLAFTIAAAASAVAVRAQDSKTTTTIKTDDAKTVTYSGCVQTGVENSSFMLENAVPVKETKIEKDEHGDVKATTSTKYVLVPGGQVDFQKEVGQKVEVTAVVIPAGDDTSKIETKTKTEVEGQKDRTTETTEKVKQTDYPQLRVMSIKHLSDRCIP